MTEFSSIYKNNFSISGAFFCTSTKITCCDKNPFSCPSLGQCSPKFLNLGFLYGIFPAFSLNVNHIKA